MSIVMELRKCPACKRTYSYNPSVGKFNCPRCGGIPRPKKRLCKKQRKGGLFE